MDKKNIIKQLKYLTLALVNKEFDKLYDEGRYLIDIPDAPVFFAEKIESWPGDMTMPPDKVFEEELRIAKRPQDSWDIEFDLWFSNEHSNLKLAVVVENSKEGGYVLLNRIYA